jgi:hypothetical protein
MNGHTIENKFDKFAIKHKFGHGFSNLTISSLDRGSYKLEIKKLNISIPIVVHDGVYWEADGFVLKKNSIIEIKNETKYLRIFDISVKSAEEAKKDISKLSFYLSNTSECTRAHVFAFTYLPNQPHEGFTKLNQLTTNRSSTEEFPFTSWSNVYQSNRKLGDEYKYVFNRKNAKRFIGNTLERPQLIMKRLKVRDTTFDTEIVKEGSAYDGIVAEKAMHAMKPQFRQDRFGYMEVEVEANLRQTLKDSNVDKMTSTLSRTS